MGVDPSADPAPSVGEAGARRPILVWFRRDLRLADNPAWNAADCPAARSGVAPRRAMQRSQGRPGMHSRTAARVASAEPSSTRISSKAKPTEARALPTASTSAPTFSASSRAGATTDRWGRCATTDAT